MSTGSVSGRSATSPVRPRGSGTGDGVTWPGALDRRPDLAARAVLAAIVIVAFAGTAIWVRAIHTFVVMPDELGYVKQSLTIAHSLRPVLPSDFYFSSWGELLPAILAPVFGSMNMVSAYYAAHSIDALLLASAAIPVFIMALELRLGRLAACLVAALTAAVPWLVFSGLVMTEDLAYPVFLWAVLGMLRAMTAPSPRRDVLAIVGVAVAFLTRTQFVVLGPILVVAIVAHEVALARSGAQGVRGAMAAGLRAAVNRHRVLAGGTGLVVVILVLLAAAGSGSSVLGHYSVATGGSIFPHGTIGSGLGQLYDVCFAGGIIPLTLSTAWVAATVGRPRAPERHAYAVLLLVIIAGLLVLLGSFVARFLVGSTVTDRYMFYVVPLLFVGMAAWVVDDRTPRRLVFVATAAVAVVVLTGALYYTTASTILNPSFNIQRLVGYNAVQLGHTLGISHLDPRIPIAVAVSAFVVGVTFLRARVSRSVLLLVVALPLLVFVGGQTAYSMNKLATQFAGVSAESPHVEAWIDRAVPSDAQVGLLVAPSESVLNTEYTWWTMSFWNKTVERTFVLPEGNQYAQGYVGQLVPDLAGHLVGLGGVQYLVKLQGDARLGLRSPLMATEGGLNLYRVPSTAPLTYATEGVRDDGSLDLGSGPLIRLFGNGSAPVTERVLVTLQISAPTSGCPCVLYAGQRRSAVPLPAPTAGVADVTFSRTVRLTPRGVKVLQLVVRGRAGNRVGESIALQSVRVTPR